MFIALRDLACVKGHFLRTGLVVAVISSNRSGPIATLAKWQETTQCPAR